MDPMGDVTSDLPKTLQKKRVQIFCWETHPFEKKNKWGGGYAIVVPLQVYVPFGVSF